MAPPNQKKTTQKEKLAAKSRKNTSSMNPYAVKKATGSPKVNAAINNLVQAIIRDNSNNSYELRRTTKGQAKATATKAAAAKNPSKTGAEGPKNRAGSTRRSSGSSAIDALVNAALRQWKFAPLSKNEMQINQTAFFPYEIQATRD